MTFSTQETFIEYSMEKWTEVFSAQQRFIRRVLGIPEPEPPDELTL